MSDGNSLLLFFIFLIVIFSSIIIYSKVFEKYRKTIPKDGKSYFVNPKTGEKYDYDPQLPLKKIIGGILLILLGLLIYLFVSPLSPHQNFADMLSQTSIINEPYYTFAIIIASGVGLVGIVVLVIGVSNYNKLKIK